MIKITRLLFLIILAVQLCGCSKTTIYHDDYVTVYSYWTIFAKPEAYSVGQEYQIIKVGGKSFRLGLAGGYYKKVGDLIFFISTDYSGTTLPRDTIHIYNLRLKSFESYGPFTLFFKFEPQREDNIIISGRFIELKSWVYSSKTTYHKIDRRLNRLVETREY